MAQTPPPPPDIIFPLLAQALGGRQQQATNVRSCFEPFEPMTRRMAQNFDQSKDEAGLT